MTSFYPQLFFFLHEVLFTSHYEKKRVVDPRTSEAHEAEKHVALG